jgi:hypothetical protein
MMKDRRLQSIADNQKLMMESMTQVLLILRQHVSDPLKATQMEKLAHIVAQRADELGMLIEDDHFASEPRYKEM